MVMRRVAQLMQESLGVRQIVVVTYPYLGQTLIGRQFTRQAARVGPLHGRIEPGMPEHVGPQGGQYKIGGDDEALHLEVLEQACSNAGTIQ